MSNGIRVLSQLKRGFKKPLTEDQVFDTEVELQQYLNSENRYAGMIVSCTETEKSYRLNVAEDTWVELGGGGISPSMFSNPGEIIYFDGTGVAILTPPVDGEGKVISLDENNLPVWVDATSSNPIYKTITDDYTHLITDDFILCDATKDIVITLASAITVKKPVTIINSSSYKVRVQIAGSDTVNSLTYIDVIKPDALKLFPIGTTNYYIV